MVKKKMEIFIFFVAVAFASATDSAQDKKTKPTNDTEQNIRGMVRHLLKNDKNNRMVERESILVLGNECSGKTAFTLFIAGNINDLNSEKLGKETIITDINNKIDRGCKYPRAPKTVYPELVADYKEDVSFYDCPGFSKENIPHAISSIYFIKNLIDKIVYIKFIFTVSFESVQRASDKADYMEMAKHATNIIEDLDTFNESIALVVTRVEDVLYEGVNKTLYADQSIKEDVAQFLRVISDSLRDQLKKKILPDTAIFYKKVIKFNEILLVEDGSDFPKIGIFRRPEKIGILRNVEIIQRGPLEKLHQQLLFIENRKKYFSFNNTIPPQIKQYIPGIIKEIKKEIKADVVKVGQDITKQYLKKEYSTQDTNKLYQHFIDEYKRILDPKEYMKHFVKNIKNNNNKNLLNILYNHWSLTFLERAIGSVHEPINWNYTLKNQTQYLNDTQNFYFFINKLAESITDYDNQKNIVKKDINDLQHQINRNGTELTKLCDFKVEPILSKTNDKELVKAYEDVENITVNSFKLKNFEKTLIVTQNHSVQYLCNNNSLLITGYTIRISDIKQAPKTCAYKSIEFLAVKTMIFNEDLNKTGEEMQLFVIAPTWKIEGQRKIILDGLPAEDYPADKPANAQREGKPGRAGNPAGNFFGIGETFKNGNQLSIYANGGRGGRGENGGRGKKGDDGIEPKPPSNTFTSQDSDPDKIMKYDKMELCTHKTRRYYYERHHEIYCNGEIGGKGMNGGAGGWGGHAGIINIINLKGQPTLIKLVSKPGNVGIDGTGGEGGKGGKDSKILTFTTHRERFQEWYWVPAQVIRTNNSGVISWKTTSPKTKKYRYKFKTWSVNWKDCDISSESGESGSDGFNKEKMSSAKNSTLLNPSLVVNNFKKKIIQSMVSNIEEESFRQFKHELENNIKVKNIYNGFGLLFELESLETLFYKLNQHISFLPFYESLLNRNNEFLKKFDRPTKDEHQIIAFLYPAILGRINSLKNNFKSNLIINLSGFLDIMLFNMKSLKQVSNLVAINNQQEAFNEKINKEVTESKTLVDKDIMPDINGIFAEINQQFMALEKSNENLLKENEKKQADLAKQKAEYEAKKKKQRIFRALGFTLKIVSFALKFVCPIASAVVAGAGTIASGIASSQGSAAADQAVAFIDKTNNGVKKFLSEDLAEFPKTIDEIKAQVDSWKHSSIISGKKDFVKTLKEIDTNIKTGKTMNTVKMYAQKINDNAIRSFKGFSKGIDTIKSILQLPGVLNRGNDKTMDQFDQAKSNLMDERNSIIQCTTNIENKLIPMMNDLQSNAENLGKNLEGKSHAFLISTRSKISSSLKSVKGDIKELTQKFNEAISQQLTTCIDKLDHAIESMINIYDKIEDSKERADMGNYIAEVTADRALRGPIKNKDVRSAIDKLDLLIKQNIFLDQYDRAMNAFIQYIFPFANLYLQKFFLPNDLVVDTEIDTLISKAVEKIEHIKTALMESTVTINKYDKDFHSNIEFNSHQSQPFLVWRYNRYKMFISKLLDGEKIILKADILKGVKKNAVKFNEIGIYIKLQDQTMQDELDGKLKHFEVALTHLGNSYYRCNTKFFIFFSDTETITYSFKRDKNGIPINKNVVFDKLKNNNFVLSPYATWSIQLINISTSFGTLAKYKNEIIDLELEGRGQFLDQDVDVCDDNLEAYYTLDNVTTTLNSVNFEDIL